MKIITGLNLADGRVVAYAHAIGLNSATNGMADRCSVPMYGFEATRCITITPKKKEA